MKYFFNICLGIESFLETPNHFVTHIQQKLMDNFQPSHFLKAFQIVCLNIAKITRRHLSPRSSPKKFV